MQYLVLIYESESRFANGYPESEFAEYGAFGKKYASAIKGGNALQPTGTAKTVRVRDAKVLTTDGPFAETKEQLGGYYLVEAGSIDEAVSIGIRHTGSPLRLHRSPTHHGVFIARLLKSLERRRNYSGVAALNPATGSKEEHREQYFVHAHFRHGTDDRRDHQGSAPPLRHARLSGRNGERTFYRAVGFQTR